MNRIWRRLTAGVALALAGSAASAFGSLGHELSGAIADALLTPQARAQVERALGMPLRVAATWADCVRGVERLPDGSLRYNPPQGEGRSACAPFETDAGRARIIDFARRNWSNCADPSATRGCHALYHFTDVAIQRGRYDASFPGANAHDVVHAVDAAIAVLRGRPAPAPFDIRDAGEALLLLSHMVGDLHQPLHVGSVYLDARDHPFDPPSAAVAHDARHDTRGGNRLEDAVAASNLHALWDSLDAPRNPQRLDAEWLDAARAVKRPEGSLEAWPRTWATETVRVARVAFEGLRYGREGASRPGNWRVSYADREAWMRERSEMQARQITLAGARMAQVLNTIWP